MRVTALCASAQLGGTERVLLDFARHAAEHNIALSVVTPVEGPLLEHLRALRVRAEAVPAPRGLLRSSQRRGLRSVIPGLAGLVSWARALRRHPLWREAEVIYTVGFKPHLVATLLRRHPVVWHLHELPAATTGAAWRWLARRMPDAIIANSQTTALAWRTGGVTVIPNGVDSDRFRPHPGTGWIHARFGIPRDHRVIGMPAVLARWKGQIEVVRAFAEVRDQWPDVHLVLVGGSVYDTVAEERVAVELQNATGHQERVHHLPFQEQIERVYPELDLVVHYSLRPEPFGRVILEAMASGVPVIAAAEGGPCEILGKREAGSGKGGWLVRPRNPVALATELRNVLTLPPHQLRSVGAEGRQRAVDHYSASTFADGVAEVLRRAHKPR